MENEKVEKKDSLNNGVFLAILEKIQRLNRKTERDNKKKQERVRERKNRRKQEKVRGMTDMAETPEKLFYEDSHMSTFPAHV